MKDKTLSATVSFRMTMRDGETYEEARERFINAALMECISLADHQIDWEIESCTEE